MNECIHTVRLWPAVLQAIQHPKEWFIKAKVLERDLHPLGSGELSLQVLCNHRIILVGRDLRMSLLKPLVLSMFNTKLRLSLLRGFCPIRFWKLPGIETAQCRVHGLTNRSQTGQSRDVWHKITLSFLVHKDWSTSSYHVTAFYSSVLLALPGHHHALGAFSQV